MASTANKLSEAQRIRVKDIVATLSLRCVKQSRIIEAIEQETGETLTQPQISFYLSQAKKDWKRSASGAIQDKIEREEAKLDLVEEQSWNEFDRSKLNAETLTTKTLGIEEKPPVNSADKKDSTNSDIDPREAKLQIKTEETLKSEGQCGDPRYLQIIINSSKQRADLLGLNAPTKQEINVSLDLIPPKPLPDMSDDELREYEQSLQIPNRATEASSRSAKRKKP
jgi:hypothetical protein